MVLRIQTTLQSARSARPQVARMRSTHSRSVGKCGGHMQLMVLEAVNELIQVLPKSTAL